MQQRLSPYVTTGIAIASVGLIAVIPAAPPLLDGGQQLTQVQQRSVALTAGPSDIFTPYLELFTNTLNNVGAVGGQVLELPLLMQILTDPFGSLDHLSDVATLLTTWLPDITVQSSGLPVQVSGDLPPLLATTLAGIGPFVTLFNALSDIYTQVTNPSDPSAALTAIVDAPATLLNAFLNGHSGIDVLGHNIPLFNGLLVSGQSVDINMNVGQIVDLAGVGKLTVGDLVDKFGLSDQTIAGLAIDVLKAAGIDNPTLTDLADQFGLGDQSVASVLTEVLNAAGIGNPTITDLAGQAGLSDQSVASVLTEVLNAAGLDTNQSIAGMAMSLLSSAGLGTDPSVADLATKLLGAAGMGDLTVTGLVQQLGVGDMSLGDLLKEVVHAVAGGDPSVTGLIEMLGGGDLTVGSLATTALDALGIGQLTPIDMFDSVYNPNPGDNITLGQLVVELLPKNPDGSDMSLAQVLALNPDLNNMTIGDLLNEASNPNNPSQSFGEMPWRDFLASPMAGGVGNETLQQLGNLNSLECAAAGAVGIINCSSTLSSLMGTNSVEQTLHNLHSTGNSIVAAGTPLDQVTLAQMLGAGGVANETLVQITNNLHLTTSVDTILTNLGLGQVTINDIVTNGFPGLFNTSVVSVLNSFGLNNLDVDTVIDRLGLNMTVTSMLNDLGMNNLAVTTVIDRLLGGVQISSILNDLGLNNVTLETFVSNLLGGVQVGSILDGLNLNNVHLDDVINSLLGNVQVDQILTNLGLNSVHLNDVINDLLGNATVGTILDDLGIGSADVNSILSGLGLSSADVVGVHLGDFPGIFADLLVNVPQQIADALSGAA
ncbi:MAG TPA: hypothetical protein VFR27_01475 [Mycobacterium sp.]|nr:hypothetical protein [Mycobacterium sp.]